MNAGSNTVYSGSKRFQTSTELHAGDRIVSWRIMTTQNTDIDQGQMQNHWRASWARIGSPTTGERYNPRFTSSEFKMTVVPEVNYGWGVPIYLNDFIPKKIKQRDLIKSIIDTFKIMAYTDDDFKNKITYELLDDFYSRGKEKNWTKKIELNKSINIEWLQDKQPKKKNAIIQRGQGLA